MPHSSNIWLTAFPKILLTYLEIALVEFECTFQLKISDFSKFLAFFAIFNRYVFYKTKCDKISQLL